MDSEFSEPFNLLEEPYKEEVMMSEPFVDPQPDSKLRLKRKRSAPPPAVELRDFVPSTITLEDPFKDQDTATRGTHAEGNSSSSSDVSSDTSSSSSDSTSHKASESSTAASDSVFLEDIPLNDSGFDSTIPHPEQLFDGSSLSVISALAILFSWFSACPGITKEAFGRLLFILHEFLLPSNNSLPASYADALALIRGLLSPTEDYHCCINDCIVYRGEYKSLTQCPQCREPRYQSGKVPRKRFKYLPIGPRIRRYFSSAQTSQLLQSHHTVASESHGIHDIHHTETWTNWYSSQGIFRGDKRGLALAICADGMNPSAKEKNTYSMWPITVSLLNLHPSLRHLPGFLQLVGVIPGKAEPKNTDPYLQIIVDELHELNDSVMFDAYQNENFFLRTAVLLHIFDYPGQNKVFHCQGAGAYAGCCYCNSLGEYSHVLTKMVYLDHRRFLSSTDPLRKVRANFPNRDVPESPPILKTMEYVDKANKRYESAKTRSKKKEIAQETGCKGRYALRKLPYHDRFLNTPTEPMHLIKNVVEHIVRLIAGGEDSDKVREEERVRRRFRSSWVAEGQTQLPPAPFRLTAHERKIANARAQNIRVPLGFDWRPGAVFTGMIAMKSHAWKLMISTPILKYCLRGLLGERQRRTLFFLCNILADVCVEVVDATHLHTLENNMHIALSLLERDFPVSLHVCVIHLLHHLPFYMRRFGPIYAFSMYSFERFNSWITRRVHNRRYPEATVLETYRLHEWAYFLKAAGNLPDKAWVSPGDDGGPVTYRPITQLDADELSSLQFYYRKTIPQYGTLCARYEEEKKKARGRHQLKAFPPIASWIPTSGPLLTQDELEMCKGMTSDVIRMSHFSYTDIHGREVKLTCKNADTSKTCSSFACLCLPDKSLLVGQIEFFFEHTFNGNSDTFAFIHWFDHPQREPETGILYVNLMCRSCTNPVVHACKLSRPLVTAIDTDSPTKLWILK